MTSILDVDFVYQYCESSERYSRIIRDVFIVSLMKKHEFGLGVHQSLLEVDCRVSIELEIK